MKTRINRRRFLAGAAAAIVGPQIFPASALGGAGRAAPSDRITIAAIGTGRRMLRVDLPAFLEQKDVQCVAVADCFAERRAAGKAAVDEHYGNHDCIATRFHEEILQRDDIDAVLIATGDRWHAVLSALAAKAGKDSYSEKPHTLTITEGRAMVNVMAQNGAVWQLGTQRRSNPSFRFAVESVRGGKIGRLKTITAYMGNVRRSQKIIAEPQPMPDPDVFDYDRWLGQCPWREYSPVRVEQWRWRWETGGGLICDMGAHYYDIAQWAHDSELSGPVEFEGTATWPPAGGFIETPLDFRVVARYADGVELITTTGPKGVRFDGDEGWLHIADDGSITAEPASIAQQSPNPPLSYAYMQEHVRNFLNCMRTRKTTASNPELAQRAHTICHAKNICLRLGRKIKWDPKAERFVGDREANNMLSVPMRAPWRI